MHYINFPEIVGYTGLAVITAVLCWPALWGVISVFILRKKPESADTETHFAFIITAYKDESTAVPLVKSLLMQHYTSYHIYLVADACGKFIFPVNSDKLTVIQTDKPLHSKVKSILKGMEAFVHDHEAVVIFDPDNLAHPKFATELNRYFKDGHVAVQGRRTAKNLDTTHACLDAAGEYYYNFIQRYVPFRMGVSAPIAGSGMGIKTDTFRSFLQSPHIQENLDNVIVAEDKQLQVDLVSQGHIIAYAENAVVYDEKVVSGPQVERQRTRWINSYFLYLKDTLKLGWKGMIERDFNKFLFGAGISMPPLFIQIVIAMVVALLGWIFWMPAFWAMISAMTIFTLNFIIALKLSDVQPEIWRALFSFPVFVGNQILATLKLKRSDREFMVTEHSRPLEIEEVMKRWGHS